MGYFLASSLENAWPANSVVSLKTHTPFSRVQERGLRYYSPGLGRWVNRDPIAEAGGVNLHAMVRNRPVDQSDPFGLTNDPGDWGWPSVPAVPGIKGAYGIEYPIPDWFNNPPDEGKPCCCSPPAELTDFGRSDSPGFFFITMNAHFKISGCYKDVALLWWTCWRPNGTAGVIPDCVNSLSCTFFAGTSGLMGPYITFAKLRYLSCENSKWVKHQANDGHTYFWGWGGWY